MRLKLPHPVLAAIVAATIAMPAAWTSRVIADEAVPSLSSSLSGDAKGAYEAGKRVYVLGDFAGAGIKFRYAYQLSKDVRLLWNWAACERAQRHYARAFNILEQYTREGKGKLSPEDLAAAAETKAALREFYSLLQLTVTPAGAIVRLDGVEIGTAPLASPHAVDLGEHTLRVESSGYEALSQRIEVPGKTVIPISISLKRAAIVSARLTIHAAAGDTIAIDGKTIGVGQFEGVVAPGSHAVLVTAPGMKARELVLEFAAGGSRTIDVTLSRDDSTGIPTWIWIAGSAVVAGGLVTGGYFLFRPKEEPGSRTLGTMGTASIPLRLGEW